jgi:hypothetical protein
MARISSASPVPMDDMLRFVRWRRRMLGVAAALVLIATAAMRGTPRRTQSDPAVELIARWARTEHVPTNGELLATFQGYRP